MAATAEHTSRLRTLAYDPQVRGLAFQTLLLLAVLWLGWSIVSNTAANLERQNIASGFGFLEQRAGFAISQVLVPYTEDATYGRALLVGILNTLLVAGVGIVFATVLGFLLGIGRLSPNWIIRQLSTVYVEVVRNTPLLLQIFFWYFAVLRAVPAPRQSIEVFGQVFINNRGISVPRPVAEEGFWIAALALAIGIALAVAIRRWAVARQLRTGERFPVLWVSVAVITVPPLIAFLAAGMPLAFDVPALKGFNFQGGLTLLPEFVALLAALSIYTAAFIAEIVRAGIQSVSHGQSEAAAALGLRRGRILRLVVIPQAMRVIIPPLTSQYLNLTKNSSLAVAIAYPDLVSVFSGTVLNQTGQAVEVVLITMAVYLTISLTTSLFMNWYNARVALTER